MFGCGPETATRPSQAITPAASVSRLHGGGKTLDDQFAEIADHVPGFGGIYYDASGNLTVRLKKPASLESVRSQVADLMTRNGRGGTDRQAQIAAKVSAMLPVQAEYDSRELLTWYRETVLANLKELGPVTMTDIDERNNRIVVGLRDAGVVDRARETLARLGIPSNAIELIQQDEAVALADWRVPRAPSNSSVLTGYSLSDYLRPMPAGAQITAYGDGPCTAGFNLVPSEGSDRYFVTASHCLPAHYSITGVGSTSVTQPDYYQIGIKAADHWMVNHDTISSCPSGYSCRDSDAALVVFDDPDDSPEGKLAWPSLTSTAFVNWIHVTSMNLSYQGEPVHMVGYRSGHTWGHVTQTCTNVYADTLAFLCQGGGDFEADEGDSGAPLVALNSYTPTATALGVVHRKISNVVYFSELVYALDELYDSYGNLGTMDPTTSAPASPPFSISITGPSTVGPNSYNCSEWVAVVTNGSPPYEYDWIGLFTSSSNSVSGTVPQSGGDLFVFVRDNNGAEGSRWFHIDYDSNETGYCT